MVLQADVDVLLSTLNAADFGSLDSITAKLLEVKDQLEKMEQRELADRTSEVIVALGRGDLAEFKRGKAFLQSKIGHLR